MARLELMNDGWIAGRWTVDSPHPAALAAVPDAIVQSLGLSNLVLSAWLWHYDEQDLASEDAYVNERRELGPHAHAHVVALARPPRSHWVWTDRLHLLVTAAHPAVASRLLGLYVGSRSRATLAVHNVSATTAVTHVLGAMPDMDDVRDARESLTQHVQFAVWFDGDQPSQLAVRTPPQLSTPVQLALASLRDIVAPW